MSESGVSRVAVLGAGSWGTALAALLAKKGHRTVLWAREPEVVSSIREARENSAFLSQVVLPPTLQVTNALSDAVRGAEFVVFVTPAQHTATVLETVVSTIPSGATLVSASKGLELRTLRRMDEVFRDVMGEDAQRELTVLSGPSFAREVAQESPTAVVIASRSETARLRVQALFQTDYFRPYTSDDVIGVEIAGALKNVIALATGIAAGLGFGHNTRAALMTRGLAEVRRLGMAEGAKGATFAGLAGMGDLVLTCTGELSRNRSTGFRIGKGEPVEEVIGGHAVLAEGVPTSEAAVLLAERIGVEMPICAEVHAILHQGSPAREALRKLMTRDPKPEEWG